MIQPFIKIRCQVLLDIKNQLTPVLPNPPVLVAPKPVLVDEPNNPPPVVDVDVLPNKPPVCIITE